jgi:hypothetical protein
MEKQDVYVFNSYLELNRLINGIPEEFEIKKEYICVKGEQGVIAKILEINFHKNLLYVYPKKETDDNKRSKLIKYLEDYYLKEDDSGMP